MTANDVELFYGGVRGNMQFPTSDLRAAVPIKEGEVFSPTAIREGAKQIQNYYRLQEKEVCSPGGGSFGQ